MKELLKIIAVDLFNSVLRVSANHQGDFRIIITARFDNEDKPLLVFGNAHAEVEDGHCIAILNPEKSLTENLRAGCSYTGGSLKDVVQGQCDSMVELWIDVYKKDGICELASYTAKEPKSPRFKVC